MMPESQTTRSNVDCEHCKRDIALCACLDIDQRLKELKDTDLFILPWCDKCDRHASRCVCRIA